MLYWPLTHPETMPRDHVQLTVTFFLGLKTLVVTCSYVEINKSVHGNPVAETKMTVHIGFVSLSTAVTADDDISS